MKVDWKEIWEANSDLFIASNWEELTEEKRRGYHLSSQFCYYTAGDMRVKVGIIAVPGTYKEDEFLYAGLLLAKAIGNGARTVIYFVAQVISPVFLGAISKLGGAVTAKAVYWREKLTPSLYPVQEKNLTRYTVPLNFGEWRPSWEDWERQLNPVAWNHLKVIRCYFESLAKKRICICFEKNKIVYRWGNIEIAEVKRKGNKFELTTKVKWTRNKSIITKFVKSGWVDLAGSLNEEFCRAINGILELLENMEMNGRLEPRDQLMIKLLSDREFIPECFGFAREFPWLIKDRTELLEINQLCFFEKKNQLRIINPVLEKPMQKVVSTLLLSTTFENGRLSKHLTPDKCFWQWDQKIYLIARPELMDELRLCQSWLTSPEDYPILLLPEDWETEGFKKLKGHDLLQIEEALD